jgi:ubiquinone/menaquinone biosynthesis C-methylase UbiE
LKSLSDWMEVYRSRAALDPLRAVLDAGDVDGLKNAYQDKLERTFLARAIGRTSVDRAIDLGCGVARLSSLLARRARVVIGLDLSQDLLDAARGRTTRGFCPVRADARAIPLAPQSVDLLIASQVFMHLVTSDELMAGAREVHRVLSEGGRAILMESLAPAAVTSELDGVVHWARSAYVATFEEAGLRLRSHEILRQMPSLLVHWVRRRYIPRFLWFLAVQLEPWFVSGDDHGASYREHLFVWTR